MTRFSVRLTLFLLCAGAIGGAAFLLWSSSQVAGLDRSSARAFDDNARLASVAIADLRAAQQSYVAAGQGEDFWFARVTAIGKEIDGRLAALRSNASAAGTAAELEAAATALQEFMQMDLRARDYTRGRQLTLASDMVFADGLELTKKAADAVSRALTAEQVGRDATDASLQRQQATVLGGAGGIVLLGLLLLLPTARAREVVRVPVAQPLPAASDDMRPDLRKIGVVARPAVAPAPPAPPTPAAPLVDLDRLAAICNDLARVPDTRAVPGLVERAAGVLDASGIVLWIADPDGRELSPILVHGYPAQLANRLGTIARDAANVTASAYRTSLLQTVKGDAISSGAIAVPLVGAAGCVGVMAAEMRNGGEQKQPLLAAASIIASQLATLVGPPSARAKVEAAG